MLTLLWGWGAEDVEELQRIPSPDGSRTAVITRTNGGATTSYGYVVHIQPGGEEAFMAYGPEIGGRYGWQVCWKDVSTLSIDFDSARWVRTSPVKGLNVTFHGKLREP